MGRYYVLRIGAMFKRQVIPPVRPWGRGVSLFIRLRRRRRGLLCRERRPPCRISKWSLPFAHGVW
jgi:hypothetical protein